MQADRQEIGRLSHSCICVQWEEELARQAAEAAAAADNKDSATSTSTSMAVNGCCGRGNCGAKGRDPNEASGDSGPCVEADKGEDRGEGSEPRGCHGDGVRQCGEKVQKIRLGGRTAKPNLLEF